MYLARHLQHRRLEAVKVLKPNLVQTFYTRFRREARAMNRLRHPNIINVYDFGQLEDGNMFLAMEYADGTSLDGILDGERIPLVRAIRMLVQMADAIDHAHSKGVIHRDLKPANMIVEQYDTGGDIVRILDFGVAKILGPEDEPDAQTGKMVIGTPAYMAPEQIKGVGDEPSIDIYALGCIAYQLATGRPPFTGSNMQVLHCHVSERPSAPEEFTDAAMPGELVELIMRCLRKRPETRPHSAATVANVLRGVLAALVNERESTTVEETLRGMGELSGVRSPRRKRATDTALTKVPHEAASGKDSQRLHAWQSALRRLAEAMVDGGCSDAGLLVAVANANQQSREVSRIRAEIEEVRSEREILDSKMHDRLLSLRFSLGELDFARKQGQHSEAESLAMNQVIGDIESQLSQVELQRTAKQAALDERDIRLAAELSDHEDLRDEAYRDLETAVHDLLPGYMDRGDIESMAQDAELLRPASEEITAVNKAP